MNQEDHWVLKYNEVMDYMKKNHRIPSRHRVEEHDLLNWLKSNRKKMNANELQEPRLSIFKNLLEYGNYISTLVSMPDYDH